MIFGLLCGSVGYPRFTCVLNWPYTNFNMCIFLTSLCSDKMKNLFPFFLPVFPAACLSHKRKERRGKVSLLACFWFVSVSVEARYAGQKILHYLQNKETMAYLSHTRMLLHHHHLLLLLLLLLLLPLNILYTAKQKIEFHSHSLLNIFRKTMDTVSGLQVKNNSACSVLLLLLILSYLFQQINICVPKWMPSIPFETERFQD